MELLAPLLTGFILGCLHAFDADHIVAVTAFSSKHPDGRKAAVFGLLWGLGHTVSLLVFGLVTLSFKLLIPPMIESFAETLVGLLLILLGVWVLKDLFVKHKIHIHAHTHDGVEHVHFHSHKHDEGHAHKHSMFWIGATHGFAGTASVMVLIPITLSQTVAAAGLYLLLFGIGTIAAMTLFAFVLGKISSTAFSKRFLPAFQGIAGLISISVGTVWIGRQFV